MYASNNYIKWLILGEEYDKAKAILLESFDTEEKTTDIIAQANIPVEINTALYKYGTHPHPSPRIMKMCADRQIPMFLSDDAHHISHVCKHFADAKAYADSFGVNLVGLNKIL